MLRLKRNCEAPYCSREPVAGGYCAKHAPAIAKRATRQERGYDQAWIEFRVVYLRAHPLCQPCGECGRIRLAEDIHHKQALADYPELKYEESNLLACCHSCHARMNGRIRKRGSRFSSSSSGAASVA